MKDGVTIDGVRYGPIEATLDREQGANVWLTFAIKEGKNREVRKVLEHLGLRVNRLIRLSYGPFELGEIKEGAVAEIETPELRKTLGPEIAKAANADFDGPLEDEPASARRPDPRAKRASKGDGRSSFEARQSRAPQDDGAKQERPAPAKEIQCPEPPPRPQRRPAAVTAAAHDPEK